MKIIHTKYCNKHITPISYEICNKLTVKSYNTTKARNNYLLLTSVSNNYIRGDKHEEIY